MSVGNEWNTTLMLYLRTVWLSRSNSSSQFTMAYSTARVVFPIDLRWLVQSDGIERLIGCPKRSVSRDAEALRSGARWRQARAPLRNASASRLTQNSIIP